MTGQICGRVGIFACIVFLFFFATGSQGKQQSSKQKIDQQLMQAVRESCTLSIYPDWPNTEGRQQIDVTPAERQSAVRRVTLLLKQGADANARIGQAFHYGKRTPLQIAFAQDYTNTYQGKEALFALSPNPDVVRALLNSDAKPNVTDEQGNTPLMWAAEHDAVELVTMLLAHNASVHARNLRGETALIMACGNASPACVRLLLHAGASVEEQNEEGATPLIAASQTGKVEVVQLLLQKGALVQACQKDGRNALHFAGFSHANAVVSRLLDAGVEVDAQDKTGMTPLMEAASNGLVGSPDTLNTLRILIDHGAQVNIRGSKGWNALWYAADHGDTKAVQFLLQQNAQVAGSDTNHETLVNLLSGRSKAYPKYTEIIRLLKHAKAEE